MSTVTFLKRIITESIAFSAPAPISCVLYVFNPFPAVLFLFCSTFVVFVYSTLAKIQFIYISKSNKNSHDL